MKGMKRPLALLLALVMAFSLLSVGAWATDDSTLVEEPEALAEIVEIAEDDYPDVEDDFAGLMDAKGIAMYQPVEGDPVAITAFDTDANGFNLVKNGTYTFNNDLTLAKKIYITGDVTDVTLDLKGHTLTFAGSPGIDVRTGAKVTIKNGALDYSGEKCNIIQLVGNSETDVTLEKAATAHGTVLAAGDGEKLTLNGAVSGVVAAIGKNETFDIFGTVNNAVSIQTGTGHKVTLKSGGKINSSGLGVNVSGDPEDLTSTTANNIFTVEKGAEIFGASGGINVFGTNNVVNVAGKVYAKTSFALCTNGNRKVDNPSNNSWSDNITFNISDGADIKSEKIGVYLPGGGEFNMTGGSIEGTTAIYNKCAKLTISGGTVKGTGGREEYNYYGNGCYNTGDAIAIDNCGYPHGDPVVSITGGTFESTLGSAIGSYYYTDKKDGPIAGGFITGGTFKGVYPVEAYLFADTYQPTPATGTIATYTPVGGEKATEYYTVFPTTLKSGAYQLLDDASVSEAIAASGAVTLDLNGKTLTSDASNFAFWITEDNAAVTLTTSVAGGQVVATAGRVVRIGAANNLDGKNISFTAKDGVTLKALANAGVSVYGEAPEKADANNSFTLEKGAEIIAETFGIGLFGTGNSVTVAGKITAKTSFGISTNGNNRDKAGFNTSNSAWSANASITIADGAEVISKVDGADAAAIYLPGDGTFTMTGGTVEGANGIYAKSSNVKISGGKIKGVGSKVAYTPNGNGINATGDAFVVEKHTSYKTDKLSVEITGGEFISAYASAVASYSNSEAAPLNGFIKPTDGVTLKLKGAEATQTDLFYPGEDAAKPVTYRVGSDGVPVKNTTTVTPPNEAITATTESATYTMTGEGISESVEVTVTTAKAEPAQEPGSGEGGETPAETPVAVNPQVDLSAIDMTGFISDNADGITAAADKKVEFAMTASEPKEAAPNTLQLDIHPQYTIGGGEAKTLDNSFIQKPMKVTLKNIFKGGKTFKTLWHLVEGVWQDVTALTGAKPNGTDLEFTSSSFSGWRVGYDPADAVVSRDDVKITLNALTRLDDKVTSDGTIELDKNTDDTKAIAADDTGVIDIAATNGTAKALTLSAYTLTISIPKGLEYVSTTIRAKNTVAPVANSDGSQTVEIQYFASTDKDNGDYFALDPKEENLSLGTVTVKATTAAVYDTAMNVTVSGKVSALGLPGGEDATTGAPAVLKLMKQWKITFNKLGNNANESKDVLIGHNKPVKYIDADPGVNRPARTAYEFQGWANKGETTVAVAATQDTVIANVTGAKEFDAVWKAKEYTITFVDASYKYFYFILSGIKINDAAPNASQLVKVNDYTYTLKYTIEDALDLTVTKTAYDFQKWVLEITGGGTWTAGDLTTYVFPKGRYGDITLTADWAPHAYTITWGVTEGIDYTPVNGGVYTYTIESGITGVPTRDWYKFIAWTAVVTGSGEHGKWSSDSATEYKEDETFKGFYGDVKLTPKWVVDLKYKFADFDYAASNEKLMLVEWKPVADNYKLTFDAGDGVSRLLYKTEVAAYKTLYGDLAEGANLYVTIVPNAEVLASDGDSTLRKFAIVEGENESVYFNGDVISWDGTNKPDGTIDVADLGNANDLFASNGDSFTNAQIGILGRLNANANKDHVFQISDLVKIMENLGKSAENSNT